jgi:hypothetical protein
MQRRRRTLAQEIAAATSPHERVCAAVDYLRTVVASPRPSNITPERADALLAALLVDSTRAWAAVHDAKTRARLARAATAGARFAVARDRLRGALLALAEYDPHAADEFADRTVMRVTEIADRLAKEAR